MLLGICSLQIARILPLRHRLGRGGLRFLNSLVANATPVSLMEHVQQRRAALKLSQRELADMLGTTMYTISEWELGKARPTPSSRQKLVAWLGFDPEKESSAVAQR